MAFTVGYALFGALAVALLLIPGLAYVIYRKPQKLYHNKWLEKISTAYGKRIEKLCRRLKGYLTCQPCSGNCRCIILYCRERFPSRAGRRFHLATGTIATGNFLAKAKEMSDTLRARTLKHSEITYMMVQAGRNDDGTDPWTASHFEVSVGIKPYKEWPKGKPKPILFRSWRKIIKICPVLLLDSPNR